MDLTEQIENGFLQLASLSDDRINKDWERCIANIGDHEGVTKIRARIDILKKKRSRIH